MLIEIVSLHVSIGIFFIGLVSVSEEIRGCLEFPEELFYTDLSLSLRECCQEISIN